MENKNDHYDEVSRFRSVLNMTAGVVVMAVIFAVGIYIYYFLSTGFVSQETFAQFGDYLGGVLNPFIGLITIIILLYSIRLQADELKFARLEMKAATEEAAKSAEAMKRQVEHLERKERLEDLESSILNYHSAIESLFSIEWDMSENPDIVLELLEELGNNPDKSVIELEEGYKKVSYMELMTRWNHLDLEHRERTVKELRYIQDVAAYAPLIKMEEEALRLLTKLSEAIAELISEGVSFRLCEMRVEALFVKLTDCTRTKLLYDGQVKAIYQIIHNAQISRTNDQPDFPTFKNKFRVS